MRHGYWICCRTAPRQVCIVVVSRLVRYRVERIRLPDCSGHDIPLEREKEADLRLNLNSEPSPASSCSNHAAGQGLGQRVIEWNGTAADVTEAPGQPGSLRTLNAIDSEFPLGDRTQTNGYPEGRGRRTRQVKRYLSRSENKFKVFANRANRCRNEYDTASVYYCQSVTCGGAPCRTRTCDLRFRRPLLYPPELRALNRTLPAAFATCTARRPDGKLHRRVRLWCRRRVGWTNRPRSGATDARRGAVSLTQDSRARRRRRLSPPRAAGPRTRSG